MYLQEKIKQSFFVILISLCLASCASVQYTAKYDAQVRDDSVILAKRIDLFWGQLLDLPQEKRLFSHFQSQYTEIEVELRNLVMRNKIRPLNDESTEQGKITLDLWLQDRAQHKKDNKFSDFIAERHRLQFQRLFIAIITGEDNKTLAK